METNESEEAVIDGAGVCLSMSSSPSMSFVLTRFDLRKAEETEVCEFDREIRSVEEGDENGTEEISSNDRPKLSCPSRPSISTTLDFGLSALTAADDTVLNFFLG